MDKQLKILTVRMEQLITLSKLSTCPRRKVAAMIIDRSSNTILAEGFNGPPRGAAGSLCEGDVCARDSLQSGRSTEIGCHHAESNAICNAARNGISLLGKSLITTTYPCLMCAKMLHHAGILEVICLKDSYPSHDGLKYLANNKISLIEMEVVS